MWDMILLIGVAVASTLGMLILYHSRRYYRDLSVLLQDAAEYLLQEANGYQATIGRAESLMDTAIEDLTRYFVTHGNDYNAQSTEHADLERVREINEDLIAQLSDIVADNQDLRVQLDQAAHEQITLSQEVRKLKGLVRDYEFADELNKVSNIEKLHEQGILFAEIERARRQISIELGATKVSP